MNKEAFDFLLAKAAADDKKDDKSKSKKDDASKDKKDDQPKKSPPKSSEIVNMNTTGGRVADLSSPHAFGGDRAGRSQAMAIAAGRDPSFGVRHPLTQALGHSTAGSFIGGGIGGLAGLGIGSALGEGPFGSAIGTGVGATAGSLLGMLTSALARREDMRANSRAYDAANAQGTLNIQSPSLSPLAAALLPLRGSHRRGQMQAYKMMSGNPSAKALHGTSATKYLGEHLPYASAPISLVGGYAQNIGTQFEARKARREELDKTSGWIGDSYEKAKPYLHQAAGFARGMTAPVVDAVEPHLSAAGIKQYIASPTVRGALVGGLTGSAYGFARQKGPNESAMGNAMRAGLVGAAGGGLIGSRFEPVSLIDRAKNWLEERKRAAPPAPSHGDGWSITGGLPPEQTFQEAMVDHDAYENTATETQ